METTSLQSLSHLQLILVREVFHQPRDLEALACALLEELEGDYLESEFDRVRDFARMWSRNFSNGVCLPSNEEVLDLPQEIFGVTLDCVPERNVSAQAGFLTK
jgi:hypothetical protein